MKKVEVTTLIQATPETIISAFTQPDMLRDWWSVERTLIDKRTGGLYTLAWNVTDQGIGFVSTGIIREYQPDQVLVIENLVYLNPDRSFLGPMTLTVKTRVNGGKTEIYVCQDGYQEGPDWDWYYDAVRQAWPITVQTLKNYLEGIRK